ncbi:MAG: DNA-directed RNA polymerase subunit B [Candidatus Micrarchaeota archaeon]|nr:DNA-directed RNA polymerase subunit B [Candidatus Micrarchaeota archaeon]MDE1833700.1 DNA-directed RNA polymerase subunit B [Candidatus Micrarchaeota archaeon]MDE1859916.1 DNA-directed RNA polymerase subunit B [Candidatus Micrarchaeota archaeon]
MANKNGKAYVYINGRMLGTVENPLEFVNEVRVARRKGIVSGEVNVGYAQKLGAVNINTDRGRIRKPYIIIENKQPKLTKDLIEKLKTKEVNFNYMLRNGIIEYLDAEEEENALVAFKEEDITDKTTHLEVDLASIFGFTINTSPYPEHNSLARHAMLANFTKQAEGLYATNFNQRFDSRAYILFYPQKPIVTTVAYDSVSLKNHPSGQNFVVALSTYYGYNMADAIVLNRAAVDRGLGRSMFYKTYADEERRYPGGQRDKFKVPPPTADGYMGEHVYAKLSDDGIIEPEMNVVEGDALIGKVAPPRFLEENIGAGGLEEKMRDDSVILKTGESGVVDSVVFTESTGATKIVKVRIRSLKVPENGDKFASRHGQKGVVALIVPPEDMPFTADGIVPDLLLNPHSIPTRLTFGHLLEMLGGKAGSAAGTIVDGSAFTEKGTDRIDYYGKELEAKGFEKFGNERLYDGITGLPFKAAVFNGVVYYNRLYHMVSNKIQVRSRGKVQILTHQPTEGKARQGALRFGEMERDALIGYGASLLLKERLLDQSDKAEVLICKECGSIGYYDHIKKMMICPLDKGSDFMEVEISYAFKVLLDEIRSLHIMPSIRLSE